MTFIHSPYFQLTQSTNAKSFTHAEPPSQSLQSSPDNLVRTKAKPEKFKKMKFDKVQVLPKEDFSQHSAKAERLEKLKKLERLKCLEKWKNTEEFIKFERDKPVSKKHGQIRPAKPIERFLNRDVLKATNKSKNLEDFIKFERDKNFRSLRTTTYD